MQIRASISKPAYTLFANFAELKTDNSLISKLARAAGARKGAPHRRAGASAR